MKKICLFLFATVVTTASFSQVKWGIQVLGGSGSAQITGLDDDDEMITKKSIFSYGAGLSSEISLGREFTLRPSLSFLKKRRVSDHGL